MTTDGAKSGHLHRVPSLYPPPAPEHGQYAMAGNVHFGWIPLKGADGVQFAVSKFRWSGGSSVVTSWPVSEDGWAAAWKYLVTEEPALADAVTKVWDTTEGARTAIQRRAENRAALDREGPAIDVLAGCVLLGGYGFDSGVAVADRVDLYFTQNGIWMTKAGGFKPYLRRSYQASRALQFEGGTIRKGGGFVGGGFGLLGAAEGIAMSALLNSLTTKSSVHTTIRFEAEDAELFFFTDQATPRNLEIRLAEVRARVKAPPPPSTHDEASSGAAPDLADRLLRLGEMLDKGHISADEFAVAKARLFAGPDQ